ncbi:MAG: MFS transporter, partial [Steroidobacteraceae bacterium]
LFVGAAGFGGMSGRLLAGVLADFYGWRAAIAIIAGLGIVCGFLFAAALPASRHFKARVLALRPLLEAYRKHLKGRLLHWLFPEGFLLMGGFVTIYNYVGYRLLAAPFSLSQAEVGLIYGVYLVGMFGSALMGDLAGKVGRPRMFRVSLFIDLAGILLTLSEQLGFVILGLALLTFGFFAAHSIASSWVGVKARHTKAQASALYLLFYYLGSSIVGSAGGILWSDWQWSGVVGLTAALIVIAVFIGLILARIEAREEAEKAAAG